MANAKNCNRRIGFLGLIGYYKKITKWQNCKAINRTRQKGGFKWNSQAQAFDLLKKITTATRLCSFNKIVA